MNNSPFNSYYGNYCGTLLTVLMCVFLLLSCKKDEVGPQSVKEENGEETGENGKKKVFVVNEGNFQNGNSTLSMIVPEEGKVWHEVFYDWTGRALGDVGQSMTEFKGDYFITINNSGKTEVVSSIDHHEKGTISGMNSPRFFLGWNSSKAFITDLYSNSIHVVDPSTFSVKQEIQTNGWTEAIERAEGKVYVANMDQARVEIIDPTSNSIKDSLLLAEQPNSMVVDKNGDLWVLCDGGNQVEKAHLYHIDPKNDAIINSFEFSDLSDSPGELSIDPDGSFLYFENDGVYRMDVSSTTLPSQRIISPNGATYYSLGVDPGNGDIYLADAKDYVQKGSVYRFSAQGAPKDTFEVGIIPGAFHFELP